MDSDFDSWCRSVQAVHPQVGELLERSAHRRLAAAGIYSVEGSRLAGLEELLNHLQQVASLLEDQQPALAALVRRTRSDFETAFEAGLSGYLAVALDAMRDVLEATDLILLFSTDLDIVDEWTTTPPEDHWRSFSPAAVRRRLHVTRVKYVASAQASVDYRGHSAAIHVTPWENPMTRRGAVDDDEFLSDAFFWEVFDHARDLAFALDDLVDATGIDQSNVSRASDLSRVAEAFEKVHMMQAMFRAMIEVAADTATEVP